MTARRSIERCKMQETAQKRQAAQNHEMVCLAHWCVKQALTVLVFPFVCQGNILCC